MGKKMCKAKKEGIEAKVKYPKFECKTCGELGVKEKHLCKPQKQ